MELCSLLNKLKIRLFVLEFHKQFSFILGTFSSSTFNECLEIVSTKVSCNFTRICQLLSAFNCWHWVMFSPKLVYTVQFTRFTCLTCIKLSKLHAVVRLKSRWETISSWKWTARQGNGETTEQRSVARTSDGLLKVDREIKSDLRNTRHVAREVSFLQATVKPSIIFKFTENYQEFTSLRASLRLFLNSIHHRITVEKEIKPVYALHFDVFLLFLVVFVVTRDEG